MMDDGGTVILLRVFLFVVSRGVDLGFESWAEDAVSGLRVCGCAFLSLYLLFFFLGFSPIFPYFFVQYKSCK